MGWKVSKNDSKIEDLNGIELATVRQISHEILKTLIPNYTKKMVIGNNGITIGGMGISVLYSEEENKTKKVGRNEKCSCGSILKYKKCHGK
ncbi:MAG: SEC-C metal-binding domain-containing protein [Candidatus Nomurabacteria bacterium]|nr:SEC-C metal-binding domain-containing protein [Candidatus Nomurabacteria bacterium]